MNAGAMLKLHSSASSLFLLVGFHFYFFSKKVHECRGHVKIAQLRFIDFIVQSLDLSILDHFLTIFYTVLFPIPLHSLYSVVGLAKIHLQGWR